MKKSPALSPPAGREEAVMQPDPTHPDPSGARPTRTLSLGLAPPEEQAIDPVCKMTVSPSSAAASTTFEGKTYYFCHPVCLARFQADPRRYLEPSAAPPPPEPVPGATYYTCPMDPEV